MKHYHLICADNTLFRCETNLFLLRYCGRGTRVNSQICIRLAAPLSKGGRATLSQIPLRFASEVHSVEGTAHFSFAVFPV